jgi:hypothetical protein
MYLDSDGSCSITVDIPNTVKSIDSGAFMENASYDVRFWGTKDQWNLVAKGEKFTPKSVQFGNLLSDLGTSLAVDSDGGGVTSGAFAKLMEVESTKEQINEEEVDENEDELVSDEAFEEENEGEVREVDGRSEQPDACFCSNGEQGDSNGAPGSDEGLSSWSVEEQPQQAQNGGTGQADYEKTSAEQCGACLDSDHGGQYQEL